MPAACSLRNCTYDATSWRVVRAAIVCQSTRSYKVCELSMGYLSTTTVMESVAFIFDEKTRGIFTAKLCDKADAQTTTPLWGGVSNVGQ